ncbi:MAG: proline dehydrogenase family protein [Candidatus Micrarchaeia archaeon]
MFGNFVEKFFAGKWIAGANIEDALNIAKEFNNEGISTLINYLGEDITEKAKIEHTKRIYYRLIDEIYKRKLDADLSIKPTQLGALINNKYLEENYKSIVNAASRKNIFVWLDMEGPNMVDTTINLYKKEIAKHNTGICIQSNLKRSINDIKKMPKNAVIRLVKGAYTVSEVDGYTNKAEVNKNFKFIMHYLFKNNAHFMVATHDLKMIEIARFLNKKYKKSVEYAFLRGIMNNYAKSLALKNEKVSIYVPFGEEWIAYSYRRMRESGHISLIFKSLIPERFKK